MCRWLLLATLAVIVGCGKPAPLSSLQPSGTTGLLGAPIPTGAKLTERRAGDPTTGHDSGEQYSISASATDIIAFFDEAMVADGWERAGPDTKNSRSFQKGGRELVVMSNYDGGTFMLTRP